jgi:hypothetical protein
MSTCNGVALGGNDFFCFLVTALHLLHCSADDCGRIPTKDLTVVRIQLSGAFQIPGDAHGVSFNLCSQNTHGICFYATPQPVLLSANLTSNTSRYDTRG